MPFLRKLYSLMIAFQATNMSSLRDWPGHIEKGFKI